MTAQALVDKARQAGIMLITAESCTGGMIGAAITDVPGSSAMFDGGFITYSNAAKMAMLGVRGDSLAAHGAVSGQVAQEMAQGALARSGAQVALSVTGIAGPGGSEHKPEGLVWFGLVSRAGAHGEQRLFGALGRAQVRQAACDHGLTMLLDHIGRHYP